MSSDARKFVQSGDRPDGVKLDLMNSDGCVRLLAGSLCHKAAGLRACDRFGGWRVGCMAAAGGKKKDGDGEIKRGQQQQKTGAVDAPGRFMRAEIGYRCGDKRVALKTWVVAAWVGIAVHRVDSLIDAIPRSMTKIDAVLLEHAANRPGGVTGGNACCHDKKGGQSG